MKLLPFEKKDLFKINLKQVSTSAAFMVSLSIGASFRTIKDVAAKLGVIIPPRKGFGYWGANSNIALWFPNMNQNPNWNNSLSSNLDYFYEQKKPNETPSDFQKRVNKGNAYNVDLVRIVFAKNTKNQYVFIGCYKLSNLDFQNCVATFKRVSTTFSRIIVMQKRIINVEVEQTTSIISL